MLEVIHFLLIFLLKSHHGLFVLIKHSDDDIFLVLHLLLKKHIICSSLLQSITQVTGDDHIHHIDLLEVNTILVEADVEVILKSRRQLTLDVSNFANFNSSDKISDRLFALLGQQFLKLVSS
jgi:hypothetical protein